MELCRKSYSMCVGRKRTVNSEVELVNVEFDRFPHFMFQLRIVGEPSQQLLPTDLTAEFPQTTKLCCVNIVG